MKVHYEDGRVFEFDRENSTNLNHARELSNVNLDNSVEKYKSEVELVTVKGEKVIISFGDIDHTEN